MNQIKVLFSVIISRFFIKLITLNRLQIWINNYVSTRKFRFKNMDLNYFFHSYNNFGVTERSIEIPIIMSYLSNLEYGNVLEIGNVTKHYYDNFKNFSRKETLDKYETAYDVINQDIKDFQSNVNFDFIFSISTFEHMDSDGNRNTDFFEDYGIFKSNAFNYIDKVCNKLLTKGGKFVLTFPLSYCNNEIGESFLKGDIEKISLQYYSYYIFKKISEIEWQQITLEEYEENKDYTISPNVNFLVVLELTK